MKKKDISYKNSYKYDFIYVTKDLSLSPKPKYVSYRNNNSIFNNNQYQIYNKTQTNFNKSNRQTHSFHKSLLHLKLSLNPKYKNNKSICNTDRNIKQRRENEFFKNNYEKIFLTNTDSNTKNNQRFNKPNQLSLITDYNHKPYRYKNYENNHISIPSNTFLPFNQNKFLNYIPDLINKKISDYINDLRMVRTVRFINNIKTERQKRKIAFLDIKFDENEMHISSLKNSLVLLNIYKRCFGDYNKFLINEIKREKKELNDYSIFKKNLEDQVNILQKKFDDLIKEFEIVNNFKQIFLAIKNKKKIDSHNKSNKNFAEELIKKLKQKVSIQRKDNLFISTKRTNITKKSIFKTQNLRRSSIDKSSKINYEKQNSLNKEEKKDNKKIFRRTSTIVAIPKFFKKKVAERFNSFQSSSTLNKKNITNIINVKDPYLDYDIERNENLIITNILNYMHIYNDINSKTIDLKLTYEKEENLEENKKTNKFINSQLNDLSYAKNYNKILAAKYKVLLQNNNNYNLHFAIYRKINDMINSIIKIKINQFHDLIEMLRKLFDKNKLFYTFYYVMNESNSKRIYFEKELINYIYTALSLIEQLLYKLISQKNIYLKSEYYQDKILEYANKMDNAKKMINSKEKRNLELLEKKKLYEKTIEKSNRIIFKSFRKIPRNIPYKIKKKSKFLDNVHEIEDLLLY